MPTYESQADELLRLRNTMRDLVALSTLPVVWARHTPEGTAASLAEILLDTLSLDLVYVQVRDPGSAGEIAIVRGKSLTDDAGEVRSVGEALAPLLTPGAPEPPLSVKNPIGCDLLRVAIARFAHTGDEGGVVACSRRVDFPTEAERVLLSVGTNQTASVLKRKRAELETEAERARLADVFQHAPSLMCVLLGSDHVIERANDRFYEVLDRRDIIGRPVRAALPEVEGQGFFEILDRVYQTGEPFVGTHMPITLRRGKQLDERIVDFVYQPMRDGSGAVSGILCQGIDRTERVRAQNELARLTAESEQQRRVYETALSNSVDFNYVFDREGRFTYVNRALLNLWGTDLAEAVGKTFFELDYPADLAARLQLQIQQVIETKRPLRDETPYTSAAGTGDYEYIFVPVFGANGSVEAVVGSTRDITDRKAMEESLREADRKKDDFIAMLAHELRNPLAPIRNGLQILRLAGVDSNGAVAEARSMMDRQLGHMVRLIDDLLDVSRINRSKMELRRARVALADVVNAALETSRPAIDAEDHELNVSLPQRPVFLDGDLTRLAQVFGNLLTNSAKYTERGGRIWLTAERRGGEVVVSVQDNGIGIPAESLQKIFDMFCQVDRDTERSTSGLGIGLALVKGLVEMHGGTVTAASEGPRRGSTFTVTLPAAVPQTEATLPAALDHAHVDSGPKRRILVVDDNRDGVESLAMMLRLIGNDVRTARDGIEALAQSEAFRPEIVLMDVGMPRLNGLDAARRLREMTWGRTMIIIALTGWGQDEDKERSREAGCDGHLVKPVILSDLERLLADLPKVRGVS